MCIHFIIHNRSRDYEYFQPGGQMIKIRTSPNKLEKALVVLKSHGGKVTNKNDMGGIVEIIVLGQKIVAAYSFADGFVRFNIITKPFFIAEAQIAAYLHPVLE